ARRGVGGCPPGVALAVPVAGGAGERGRALRGRRGHGLHARGRDRGGGHAGGVRGRRAPGGERHRGGGGQGSDRAHRGISVVGGTDDPTEPGRPRLRNVAGPTLIATLRVDRLAEGADHPAISAANRSRSTFPPLTSTPTRCPVSSGASRRTAANARHPVGSTTIFIVAANTRMA